MYGHNADSVVVHKGCMFVFPPTLELDYSLTILRLSIDLKLGPKAVWHQTKLSTDGERFQSERRRCRKALMEKEWTSSKRVGDWSRLLVYFRGLQLNTVQTFINSLGNE